MVQVRDAAVNSKSDCATTIRPPCSPQVNFWLWLFESFTGPNVTLPTSDRPAALGSLCNWRHGAVSVYPEGRRLVQPLHLPPFESSARRIIHAL